MSIYSTKVYNVISRYINDIKSFSAECLIESYKEKLNGVMEVYLPNGPEFTHQSIDFGRSSRNHIVLHGDYCIYNESGFQEGWKPYELHIKADLEQQFKLSLRGLSKKKYPALIERIKGQFMDCLMFDFDKNNK